MIDVNIAVNRYVDFGGDGSLLHLATANGFPPEAYRPLAHALAERMRVLGYRGRPLWTNGHPQEITSWHDLANDLLHDLAQLAPGSPAVGLGHSLGGIMTLFAALRQPELFRALILIDPVFMPRRMLPIIWLMRNLRLQRHIPLARSAARRRFHFTSADAALNHYRGRGVFAHMTPDSLAGYIEGGLRPNGNGGMTLTWSREWESRIFSLVPIDTWDAVTRVRLPILFIRGAMSDLIIDRTWTQLQRLLPHARFVELDGGHMIPFEQPQAVAQAALDFIDSL